MTTGFAEDVSILKRDLVQLPQEWEGKASVLDLKAANYNWRQMEWWAFYFEHLCFSKLRNDFAIPGERFGNVGFDLKRNVNWDLKSKAIKSDDHRAILNDKTATEKSITLYGEHGVVIALCDVEYNDIDRSFQNWHTELKGGKSKYEEARILRTNVSRYRKTRATLNEILFLRFTASDLLELDTMRQGRNSNGKPRFEKYMLNLEKAGPFVVDRIVFNPV